MNYPVVRIGEILELKYGKSLPSESRSGTGCKVYGSNGMTGRHEIAITSAPAIIVGRKGSIGEIHYSENPCWPIDTTYYVDSFKDSVIPRWLYHRLKNTNLKALNKAVAIPGLNRNDVYQLEIPLPPPEEQRRIAAILDKASQILIASRKADELRQLLLERVFTSMFGDPRENPIGWPKLAIEELTSDYVGGAALVPEDFEDEGVPVLHKGAIKPGGRIEADSRKKGFVSHQTAQHYLQCLAGPGRIAVTLRDLVPSGPFIGLMADLSTTGVPEYLLAQGAYAFKVDARRLLPDYLVALVNMPTFRLVLRQNAVGSTQIHIRLPIFKSIEIPVPPIESQLEFAQVIDRISSLNTQSRRQVHHVDELTRSLHGSYF